MYRRAAPLGGCRDSLDYQFIYGPNTGDWNDIFFNATIHSKLSSESAERADDYLGILSSEKLVSQTSKASDSGS